jgi:hypothetical protein
VNQVDYFSYRYGVLLKFHDPSVKLLTIFGQAKDYSILCFTNKKTIFILVDFLAL